MFCAAVPAWKTAVFHLHVSEFLLTCFTHTHTYIERNRDIRTHTDKTSIVLRHDQPFRHNTCIWQTDTTRRHRPRYAERCAGKQEAQLMLTNLCDAFRGQPRSPNIVPFHILGIVSCCAIVTFVFKTRCFSDIRLQKCCDLEIRGTQCPWKWYHSTDSVWFPISVL